MLPPCQKGGPAVSGQTEAARARVLMVLRPLPAAQRGKKNAEPGKSRTLFSGVEGAGIDRAGAARAWHRFGIGGKRAVLPAPWVCFHPWPVPGT